MTDPEWLTALRKVVGTVRAEDLSAFRPPEGHTRRAGVLLLFGQTEGVPDVLLTERAGTLRSHAGQVSFPGGSLDPQDTGPVEAALREAQEETGLDPAGVEVLGALPELYIPVSDYTVTPVLGWWRRTVPVSPVDPAEVVRVVRVPLPELADPEHRFLARHPRGFTGPGFRAGGLFVWGFTASLLDALLRSTGWERPWDVDRLEDIPFPGQSPRQENSS
jgi:8-oxo-dGTP pyrophosphatase MutT (NUDIX family)